MKPQCPLPISIVIGECVADVSHAPIISNTDGTCENLVWDQLLIVQVRTI